MFRALLLTTTITLAGIYNAPQSFAQDFGFNENGTPNCSPTYDGPRELGEDDRTYGWDETNGSGTLETCVVTTGRVSPINQCINLGGDLESAVFPDGTLEDFGYNITGEDLDSVVDAGFDTVRIPIRWSAFTGNGPRFRINRSFWRDVDIAVTASLNRGLNVIIDVHHFDEFNVDPDGQRAKLFAIWRQISSHYRNFDSGAAINPNTGVPAQIIFELLNEPHFENLGGQLGEEVNTGTDVDFRPVTGSTLSGIQRINNLNQELLQLIRRRNPERWVIVGSSQFGTIGPILGGLNGERFIPPQNDRRIITTAHYYDPINFTHQRQQFGIRAAFGRRWGNRADRDLVNEEFDMISEWQSEFGRDYPFLLGEFGTTADTRNNPGPPSGLRGTPTRERRAYALTVRRAAEENNFAWCYWDLGSPSFGIFEPDTNVFEGRIINQLIP